MRRSEDPAVGGAWRGAACLAALWLLACLIFAEAVRDPGVVPAGLDLLQHYSREAFVRRALAAWELPLWNPHEFSGFPGQADPQVGVFYPPSMVLRLLPIPAFLTWTIVFHVWLFGAGGYALGRALGLGRATAAIAASALMLGGITLPRVYAGHLDVLRTAAWIPLVLALAWRSFGRGTWRPHPGLVLSVCALVLASFFQLVVYTGAVIALIAVFQALRPASGTATFARARLIGGQMAVLVLLAAGLLAFQLLPTARLVHAAGRTAGMPYDDAVDGAIGPAEWPRLLRPLAGGAAVASESWESSAYVGLLLIALVPLAFAARRWRRPVVFLAALGLGTLALAAGDPLYQLHHALFPMFRIPGRLIVFWAIAAAMLGAIALEWLTGVITGRREDAPPARRWRAHAGALLLAAAAAAVVADLVPYARQFVQPRRFSERFAMSLPFTPTPGGRVLSLCENRLHPLELAALGVESVDGYNSYFLADYARFAEAARAVPPASSLPAFPRIGDEPGLPDLAVLAQANVTEIVTCQPAEHRDLRLIAQQEPFYVYRNLAARGRVRPALVDISMPECERRLASEPRIDPATTSGAAKVEAVVADGPDGRVRFVVTAPRPQALLLAEPYYPERRAWVDNRPWRLDKVNTAFMALCLPAGQHVVDVRYLPRSLQIGTGISLLTLVGWIATRRRSRAPLG